MSWHFYPLLVWSFGKMQDNPPKTGHSSRVQRQKLVHPKDNETRHKQSNVVSAVQYPEECKELYIQDTKQPLHKQTTQHRPATFSGQDLAVHPHLKKRGRSFEDSQVCGLEKIHWFETGVMDAIYVKLEKPFLNTGGGRRRFLPPTYNVLRHSFRQPSKR